VSRARLQLGGFSPGTPCEGQLSEESTCRLTIRVFYGLLWPFYEKNTTERLRNLVVPRRSVMKEDPSSFIILACADDICDDVQRFSTRTHMCVFSCLKLL
jgi:hypothetical protein